jgi:hypothetical protein
MTPFDPAIIETGTPYDLMNNYGKFCRQTFAPIPITHALVSASSLQDAEVYLPQHLLTVQHVPVTFTEIDTHRLIATHCVLGICGESYELDKITDPRLRTPNLDKEVIEELGDIAYYLCVYATIRGLTFSSFVHEGSSIYPGPINPMESIDVIKRFFFYNNEDYQAVMDGMFLQLGYTFLHGMLLKMPEADFRSIFRENYKKLTTRYPNLSFSSEDAARRADKVDYDDAPTITNEAS